jgi:hypothetical protein
MCNQEQLISYLYDDLSAADRSAFEAHLAQCAACQQEVVGLRQTRQHLASWAPPDPVFNFQVVKTARTPPPRRRFAFGPQWGLAAAAAVLLMAGAAAIANVEMRYGPDGFVVRTGWGTVPAAPAADQTTEPTAIASAPGPVPPAPVNAGTSEELMEAVRVLTRRVQELEQAQTFQVARASASSRAGITTPELRKILAESEARQRMEMALRIEQVWKDFNAARHNDFVRVQQTVGPELQRQRRMLENVALRTPQK